MSFLTTELSSQDGRPVFLLAFSRTGKSWLYTNADQDIVFDAQTYLATPATITSIAQSGDAKAENVEISMPASATLSAYLELITPTEAIKVVVRKIHMTEDVLTSVLSAPTVVDAPVVWVGEVVDFGRPTLNSRSFTCNTLALSLSRGGLRLSWGRNCPHVLYGRGCNLNKELFVTPLTAVSVIDGVTLGAAEFGSNGNYTATPVDITDELTSFTGWSLNPGQAAVYDYASSVFPAEGSTAFGLSYEHNESNPAYAIRNFGTANLSDVTVEFDAFAVDTGGNDSFIMGALIGCDSKGNGARVVLSGHVGGTLGLAIHYSGSFLGGYGIGLAGVGCSTSMSLGVLYTIKVHKVITGSAVAITAQAYVGASLVGTAVATTDTAHVKSGGFSGPIGLHSDDNFVAYFRRFRVTSPGVNAPASFSGGFIEWNSEPGVLERTGIESDTVGSAKVFGTTHGMSGGSNFRAFVGCDRTATTCQNVFRNLDNYGGVNHMQGKSPFDGQPIF